MTVLTYVSGALVVVTLCETWCLWRVLAAMGSLSRLEDRVTHLAATMELLTDTTEACFQAVGAQIGASAQPVAARPAGPKSRQRRIVGASRRGRSVRDIAAQEAISESETALQLHMAEKRKGRKANAALRS